MTDKLEKLLIKSTGFQALHEISAFLGGVLFTILVFFLQYKENYQENLHILKIKLPITKFLFLSLPMSISSLLFILSSIMCGISGMMGTEDLSEKFAAYTSTLFLGAVLFLFISILQIYFLIDTIIGIIGLIILIMFFYLCYFIYRYIGVYFIE